MAEGNEIRQPVNRGDKHTFARRSSFSQCGASPTRNGISAVAPPSPAGSVKSA